MEIGRKDERSVLQNTPQGFRWKMEIGRKDERSVLQNTPQGFRWEIKPKFITLT